MNQAVDIDLDLDIDPSDTPTDLRHVSILMSDSYKLTHWLLYPSGMRNMHSYLYSRGSDKPFLKERTVVLGIQAILKKFFVGKRVTMRDVDRAKQFCDRHIRPGVFNYDGWKYIVDHHNGHLPLKIRGVKEGTILPTHNVILTVEATDPKCDWLVSFFEPLLLQLWYPITVATLAFEIKKAMEQYWKRTVDDERMGALNYALHDFGFRGASSPETAEIGGLGPLLSFSGSDTMVATAAVYDFYGMDESDPSYIPSKSVIASEHTVMCANSDAENRIDEGAVEKLVGVLEAFGAGTVVSAVADTYDVFRFTEEYVCGKFKDRIINSGGTFVVRPDSGDPVEVVIKVMDILMSHYEYTVNSKGFKVLPSCVRVLQGDGINAVSVPQLLGALEERGIAAENLIMGMGGALLQHCDRDWMRFAMKAGAFEDAEGEWHDVFKDPITDSRKRSLRGRLTLYKDQSGRYFTDRVELAELPGTHEDQAVTYLENGILLHEETWLQIEERYNEFYQLN